MISLFSSKKINAILGGLAVALLALAYLVHGNMSEKSRLKKQMLSKQKEVKRFLSQKNSPRKEENATFKRLILLLSQKYQEIVTLSAPKKEKIPDFAPLEFKEELLKIQTILKENAGFVIPVGIGFKDYIGGVIPKQDEIPKLTRQLYMVKDVIELMINSKVTSISDIVRNEEVLDNPVYQTYLFEFKFISETDSLMKFLTSLQKAKYFAIVHRLNISRMNNLSLSVELTLRVIDFKESGEK